jgi:hypothetical protein
MRYQLDMRMMFGHIEPATAPLFQPVSQLEDLRRLARDAAFTLPTILPVFAHERPDLLVAAQLAAGLYGGIARPEAADVGIMVGQIDPIIDAAQGLWHPLANRWHFLNEGVPLPPLAELGDPDHVRRIVVLSSFRALTSTVVNRLLHDAYDTVSRDGAAIGFITGRDASSIAWHVTKQWCAPRPDVTAVGIFTDGEKGGLDPRQVGQEQIDSVDVQTRIFATAWKRLLVRGHARDDNLNLGDYTICGRNETVLDEGAKILRPRCGYGYPCFKDEAKLIPLNRVPALEVVLSGCNAGPFADYALYSQKYQLHLNGIDGPARTIVSVANYVHASGVPENEKFLSLGDTEDIAASLNASLRLQSTVPSYWTFGMPGAYQRRSDPDEVPSRRLCDLAETLDTLQALAQPGEGHALARQIVALRRSVDAHFSRNQRTRGESNSDTDRVWSTVRDLDRKLMEGVLADPDDSFVNLANVVLKRSAIVAGSCVQQSCTCGREVTYGLPVDSFSRDLFARTRPPFLCTMCQVCCEESYRFPQGVELTAFGEIAVCVGGHFDVEIRLGKRLDGDTLVTLVFPSYVQKSLTLEPHFHRVQHEVDRTAFRVNVGSDVIPQAYHFTVFATKDLAVSTYRKTFKVYPPNIGLHEGRQT